MIRMGWIKYRQIDACYKSVRRIHSMSVQEIPDTDFASVCTESCKIVFLFFELKESIWALARFCFLNKICINCFSPFPTII